MKTNMLFKCLFLFAITGITACEAKMDNLPVEIPPDGLLEISPDSQSQTIETEVDGIAFKFCLLNEQGKPATVLNEGENFRFYFSVTNKTTEKLVFVPDFARTRDGFCEVFTLQNQTFGRPFIFCGVELIAIPAYRFDPENSYVFEQPWMDSRDSTWTWKYSLYSSSHQTSLPTGNYFTEFQSRFQFYYPNSVYTDSPLLDKTLTFKINFQIK